MKSFRIINGQSRRIVASLGLLLATIAPAFTPALAAAAQVTDRSIELSSSSKSATNVTYKVNFTSVAAAGAFVVEFCSDTPLIGQTCTAPGGFNASSAASTTSGFTDVTGSTGKFVVAGTIGATTPISVEVTGITNPNTAGPLYARIVTYDTKVNALAYTSTALGTGAADQGGLALSITETIGVSAAVLETMTFCVAGADITVAGCGGTLTAPSLTIGETAGTTKALSASAVSTGDIYTQISTNAASGAIVSLKNSIACGGMKRLEATGCDIAPALQTNITAGQAKFGLIAAADTTHDAAFSATGAYQVKAGTGYNGTTYALNYASGDATGVTSPYGDPLLDTNDAPVSNKTMKLTFGASVSNTTPAGNYSATLSMIATGKF